MDLLKQLLDEAKKPSLKKAAKSVYHRDYMKTRKKPYRQYDPETHQKNESVDVTDYNPPSQGGTRAELLELVRKTKSKEHVEAARKAGATQKELRAALDEGAMDFVKGVAQHVGGNIKQGVSNTINAGKIASAVGDLSRELTQLVQLLAAYDKTKPQQKQEPTFPAQDAAPEEPQGAPNAGGVSDAFRTTEKPKGRVGQNGFEFAFSSYLQTLDDNTFLSEGVWDFIKGAGKHVAGAVTAPVKNAVAAGSEASATADAQRAKSAAQVKVREIVKMLKALGPDAGEILSQAAQKSCGPQAQRCLGVITKAAEQLGVPL